MAKTVAKGSILYTPFYSETGWEFLDKYFDHKRLVTQKGKNYDYQNEKDKFCKISGFDRLWKQCRTLETTWLKHQTNLRRYGKVHENLQMFVDEQLWRAQHPTLN
jgi:hypothetical protein